MMRYLPLLCFFATIGWGAYQVSGPYQQAKRKFRPFSKAQAIGATFEQEYLKTKNPQTGEVTREVLMKAEAIRKSKLQRLGSLRAVAGLVWEERGPNNVAGRTRAVHYDLNDAARGFRKVWAGGVSGGLWFTNDISAPVPLWQQVNDLFENMAITTIAQDPSNPQIMYFGTGEGFTNFDAVRGLGVWKSTNGGLTWAQLPSTNISSFFYVQKIEVLSNGTLLVAARSGLYRSTDQGSSFTRVLGNGLFGCVTNPMADLEIAADGTLFVSAGMNGAPRDGIFRSSDQGVTWTRIFSAVNPELRIELAQAPSDANVLYALLVTDGGNFSRIIKTTNALDPTVTWQNLATPAWCDGGTPTADIGRGQGWYNLIGMVDATNPNIIYMGLVDLFKSTNGGTSWTQITQWATGCPSGTYVHADHHALEPHPTTSDAFLLGTDGGVYRTTNGGVEFSSRNQGLNITQYYTLAQHPTNVNYFLGGTQDNGTQQYSTPGINRTREVAGGDGGPCFIDQDNPQVQIISYVYNNYFVSTNGGSSFNAFALNNNGMFINSAVYDSDQNKLYAGNQTGTLLRWNNASTGAAPDTTWVTITGASASNVSYLKLSPHTPNRLYVGLYSGMVYYVDNIHVGNNKAAQIVRPAGGGAVSGIDIDPNNEEHLLISYSSYGVASVLESNNGTSTPATWTNVEGDLPDMPVRAVMFDPRNSDWAIIGTELGVWSTDNLNGGATQWNPTNSGLANVRIDAFAYNPTNRILAVATHGRGLYTAVVPTAASATQVNFQGNGITQQEQSTILQGCRTYKDYSIQVSLSRAPTGTAVATISVNNGGTTAQRYIDYDFTTNGSFTSGSNTLTFADGQTEAQSFVLRIYDDSEVEPNETVLFDLAISGTTDAQVGTTHPQFTATITDNDVLPNAGSTNDYSTGAPQFFANTVGPFSGANRQGRFQYIVYAAELQAVGLKAGPIQKMTWQVFAKNSTGPFTNMQVKIGHTHSSTLQYGFWTNPLQTVYAGNYTTVLGANEMAFSSAFLWNGVDNLLIDVCYSLSAAIGSDDVLFEQSPTGNGDIPTAFRTGTNGTVLCGSNALNLSTLRPSLSFTQTLDQTLVAGTLNTLGTIHLGPFGSGYVNAPTGELLARLVNNSAHDFGCTEVRVDRAGTNTTAFWNNNVNEYLTNKTFKIIPTHNNNSASVDITIYYTEAEKLGWENATGQSWTSIQMIKVPSLISNVTPATPYPDGPGTVQIVVPTRSTIGTFYGLTSNFTNGFSGLGAGTPGAALPVTWYKFTGMRRGTINVLEWSTASEENNKGFFIERSFNNNDFTEIGFVASKGYGNSAHLLSYEYADRSVPRGDAFYRLKQVDLNGRASWSKTILIKANEGAQSAVLINNPIRNRMIQLNWMNSTNKMVQIKLVDLAGRTHQSWKFTSLAPGNVTLSLPATTSTGGYFLQIEQENGRQTIKCLVE